MMRVRGITWVLATIAVLCPPAVWPSEKETEPYEFPEAKVVWVADEPTCPLTDGRPHGEIDNADLSIFSLEGDVTEPKLKSRLADIEWTEEQIECFRQGVGLPIYQVLINQKGYVEEIVRIRDQPECWTEVMVDLIRKWRFEPATQNGEAVCVAYIMTMRFHPI